MFQQFNIRYFAGRLRAYKILLVYDVWYWETKRCGYPPSFPPACEAVGFIDFTGRQISIRFLGHHWQLDHVGIPDPRKGPCGHRWRAWRQLARRDGVLEGSPGKRCRSLTADIYRLLTAYADAGNTDRLYENEMDLLEAVGFDMQVAGAELLGHDVAHLCSP